MAVNLRFLLLLSTLFFTALNTQKYEASIGIRNFRLWPCNTKQSYPVKVSNVKVTSLSSPDLTLPIRIVYSGTLSTDVELLDPIKATLEVYRDVMGVWIKVPCENNIGSCTYNDLCKFGIPTNESCPIPFSQNDVPCRCPIEKGNYTIAPKHKIPLSSIDSVYSGNYKGDVQVLRSNRLLSCYFFNFQLYDTINENRYESYQVNIV